MNKCNKAYVEEMLNFARTLKGRELNKTEARIRQEGIDSNDEWHYFMVFGIQPDTQNYIDYTIQLLEKCESIGEELTAESRLNFSVEDLGVKYPKASLMEKNWLEFEEWKTKKDASE